MDSDWGGSTQGLGLRTGGLRVQALELWALEPKP